MNKVEFAISFRKAIEETCSQAEQSLGRKLDRNVAVKLYGAGCNGNIITPEEFLDKAYIDERNFYRLIDIMVTEVDGAHPIVFARISDHAPSSLAKTWNGLNGPFKVLEADNIIQR